MKKNIEVIIKNSSTQLGKKGEVIKVTHGYAFNYLIPNNLAELITKGKLKHLQMIQEIKNKELNEKRSQSNNIQKQLQQIYKISINKTIGKQQQIFGSINEKEILNILFKYTGKKFEKKQIKLSDIKKLGIYNINIQILHNINAQIKLQILPYLKGSI